MALGREVVEKAGANVAGSDGYWLGHIGFDVAIFQARLIDSALK